MTKKSGERRTKMLELADPETLTPAGQTTGASANLDVVEWYKRYSKHLQPRTDT